MLKKFLLIAITGLCTQMVNAQVDWNRSTQQNTNTSNNKTTETTGFDRNRLFIGGGLDLGLGSLGGDVSSWSFGLSPIIGYSVSERFDFGGGLNLNYYSYKDSRYSEEVKSTYLNMGLLGFGRFYPFQSLFIQAQPELNWINRSEKYTSSNGTTEKISLTTTVPSFLVGVGYGSRDIGTSGFYTTIMFDLLNEPYSPYRSFTGGKLPILKFGFMYYLGRK
ncbi:hypothetical protein [Polluticaenibacter yanchengensis]|uniref:Outer membrane protein beta-barrel domain-containing protein n=1 Tax=Polluticaenibacter yanchengensis TaxID=3014562 RepID=A0ABT4UIJ4_9BACT|nr:hypothetical protein [Chitinophagaceae bacterium LY-5]